MAFRFMDDPPLKPLGRYAVACVEPGISGRWVYGADRHGAFAVWDDLYDAGTLTEQGRES